MAYETVTLDEDYDPYDDEIQERKPKVRQPVLPRCVHCPDREVLDDGKSGYVHADDLKYSCTYGDKNTTFAAARQ